MRKQPSARHLAAGASLRNAEAVLDIAAWESPCCS